MSEQQPNRLINQKSPYLLQHAYNPVAWYPWGPEAFEAAKKADLPIFLSIGYATCHWCHVMEKESFENVQIASQLNQTAIAIKVDREERPDIDALYMEVAQLATGQGGWPLSLFLDHEARPFYAATYIPPKGMYGRIGMDDLLENVARAWREKRSELHASAEKILGVLKNEYSTNSPGQMQIDPERLCQSASEYLSAQFDRTWGGFSPAPKFPTPHHMLFLLRHYNRTRQGDCLEMVCHTIRCMYQGGIYDQVGFGFHRYSTDATWKLPHFEKMLYDQALLLRVCSELFLITGDSLYRQIGLQIHQYVSQQLRDSDTGAFFCAQDADSQGSEGAYYIWSQQQLEEILSPEEFSYVKNTFHIKKGGNFTDEATGSPTGENILYALRPQNYQPPWSEIQKKLLHQRQTREKPLTDTKILCDWNSLYIASLAYASRCFKDENMGQQAKEAMEYHLDLYASQKGLVHCQHGEHETIPAMADDYAFSIWALLELLQLSGNLRYLELAVSLQKTFSEQFFDQKSGVFSLASHLKSDLIITPQQRFDGAYPSANSVAFSCLSALGHICDQPWIAGNAQRIFSSMAALLQQHPQAATFFLCGVETHVLQPTLIILRGQKSDPRWHHYIAAINDYFIPGAICLMLTDSQLQSTAESLAPWLRTLVEKPHPDPVVYICSQRSCQAPLTDLSELKKRLSTLSCTEK